jgi:tRNA A-37 threonylcarbamoyl transferase component Bud32/tetratricopeptide (TPR) repeat protein
MLEKLGEGGMGVVYLAEQETPIRRRVALKLIKLGLDTRQVIARFESERQALALMQHPNVAAVYDAGATEDGRPYFVMEYVAGVPITEYADRYTLAIPERLRLFVQACEAIQHAHQKGVIHRDVKPTNVLVADVDGVPTVKVIDFGVAKATTARLTEQTFFTQHGIVIGTPAYMSPEQADPFNADVDTRTDVYSLGVLLYELAAGALPFDTQALLKAGYDEIRRRIREDDPPRPSTRFGGLGDSSIEAARNRRTDPKTLQTELRGDLDWVVMNALEKDPARRYSSPSALGADLRRYLSHQPVEARPPNRLYRLRKLARRHRGGVIAGTTAVTALVVATAITAWQSVEARRQRDAAVYQQQRAEASNEFLYLLLNDIGPGGKPLTLVELLDHGVAMLDRQHGAAPRFMGRMFLDLANGYFSLGATGRTLDLLARVERAARASGDSDLLAAALCGQVLWRNRDDPSAARAQVEEARKSLARVRAPSTDTFVACARADATIVELQGDRRAAIEMLRAARARLAASPVATVTNRLHLANQLAVFYTTERQADRAIEINREILTTMEAAGHTGSLGYLITSLNQAFLLQLMGEVKSAFELRSEVLGRVRELEQSGNAPRGFANQYAGSLLRLARYDEALQVLEEEIKKSLASGNRYEAANSELTLGRSLMLMKRYDEAVVRLDSAESFFRTAPAVNDRQLVLVAITRAKILAGRGDSAGARQAIESELTTLGYPARMDAPDLAHVLRIAAEIAIDTQDAGAGERYATDFLAAAERSARDPSLSADVGYALLLRASACLMLGNAAAARSDLDRALPSLTSGLGADHPDTREARRLRSALGE